MLLEENIEGTLQDIGAGNDFLDRTSIDKETNPKIDKWDCIKLKNCCTANKINKMKLPLTKWEN
jgi:hypothetical protein